ncbi:hypothetical protein Tco_0351469 [Tanacetum coccineum]
MWQRFSTMFPVRFSYRDRHVASLVAVFSLDFYFRRHGGGLGLDYIREPRTPDKVLKCFVYLVSPDAALASKPVVALELSLRRFSDSFRGRECYEDVASGEASPGGGGREREEGLRGKKLLKRSDPLPAKRLRIDHPSLASGTGGKSLASLRQSLPEGSLTLGASSPADIPTHVTMPSGARRLFYPRTGRGGSSQPETSEESDDCYMDGRLEFWKSCQALYDARGVLLWEKRMLSSRMKSLLKEKETGVLRRGSSFKLIRGVETYFSPSWAFDPETARKNNYFESAVPLEQSTFPIYYADVNAVVGVTFFILCASYRSQSLPTEGARKHYRCSSAVV